jgi:hypothetical protein
MSHGPGCQRAFLQVMASFADRDEHRPLDTVQIIALIYVGDLI